MNKNPKNYSKFFQMLTHDEPKKEEKLTTQDCKSKKRVDWFVKETTHWSTSISITLNSRPFPLKMSHLGRQEDNWSFTF